MKQMNWNLERVKPGDGTTSIKEQTLEIISGIDQTQTDLENQTRSKEISDVIEVVKLVQNLYNKAFGMDEYITCQLSINISDPEAQVLSDLSNQLNSYLDSLLLVFGQYLASISETGWHELIKRPEIKEIKTYLIEQRRKVKDQLNPETEKAIHSLSINGFNGWEDHYEQEYASLTVPVDNGSDTENLSFDTAFMRMMLSSVRTVRESIANSIYQVSCENENRFASVFNHFAGYRIEIYRLRGWSNPLKEMLEQNRISESSVKNMIQTLHHHKTLLHEFLIRKAKLNQVEKLNWYDVFAPTFVSSTSLTYEEAADIVIQQFYNYSEKMGEFAEQAFNEGWIDAEPSEFKRYGAFCASLPNAKESRVLLSFSGSYQDVVTLAHELGHAYHNLLLHEQSGFALDTGTALAETASTFTENLVLDAAIGAAETEEDRLSMLEMKIVNGLKYTANIPANFEFEQQFYEKRSHQKLSTTELTDLMEKSKRNWFDDTLKEVDKHDWMTIPHFYDTQKPFYVLSYTIGYLFSNGLYSLYSQDKETFPERYDQLLRYSGNQTMEELVNQFLNLDLNTPSFWEKSLQPLERAIQYYLEQTKNYL